jgi:hypothetical protein
MSPAAATEARPLTPDEQATLENLLARASFGSAPAVRIGDPYVALINLSVPRRGDKDHQSDLVYAGETVYLTEEEANRFNRKGNRDGRQVDVVQKLSGPDGSHEEPARVPPRAVSGRLFQPATPQPGSDAPRPDPKGSSVIEYVDYGNAPEASGAMTGDPSEMADHLREAAPDAVDLPPTRRTRARARE